MSDLEFTIKADHKPFDAALAMAAAGFDTSTTEGPESGEYVHTFTAKSKLNTALSSRYARHIGDLARLAAAEQEAEYQRQRDLFFLSAHGYPADLAEKALSTAEAHGVPVAFLVEQAQREAIGPANLGNLGYAATAAVGEVAATAQPAPSAVGRGRGESKSRRQMAKASRRRNRRK